MNYFILHSKMDLHPGRRTKIYVGVCSVSINFKSLKFMNQRHNVCGLRNLQENIQ